MVKRNLVKWNFWPKGICSREIFGQKNFAFKKKFGQDKCFGCQNFLGCKKFCSAIIKISQIFWSTKISGQWKMWSAQIFDQLYSLVNEYSWSAKNFWPSKIFYIFGLNKAAGHLLRTFPWIFGGRCCCSYSVCIHRAETESKQFSRILELDSNKFIYKQLVCNITIIKPCWFLVCGYISILGKE